MALIVLGSVVLDIIATADRLPHDNETLLAEHAVLSPGGKGANQALAASRFGAEVKLISCVGNDVIADLALQTIRTSTVDLNDCAVVDGGTALGSLHCTHSGTTRIMMYKGVFDGVSLNTITDAELQRHNTFLCQSEVPVQALTDAILRAKKNGCRVILNYAPVVPLPEAVLSSVDMLLCNEVEADQWAELRGVVSKDREGQCRRLAEHTGIQVILTLGDKGALAYLDGALAFVPTLAVHPVDPAGAGDAFCGTFAAALDLGYAPLAGLRYAAAAGALVCLGMGAQWSLADRDRVEEYSRTLPAPHWITIQDSRGPL